jgi:hypothetical protein
MNVYICFYKHYRVEVYADTSYEAQCKAQKILKVRKGFDISVILAEKEGTPVIHKPEEVTP